MHVVILISRSKNRPLNTRPKHRPNFFGFNVGSNCFITNCYNFNRPNFLCLKTEL